MAQGRGSRVYELLGFRLGSERGRSITRKESLVFVNIQREGAICGGG